MNLKSFLYDRAPIFTESKTPPVHLADFNERHYYAFAKDEIPPSGGKKVNEDELSDILSNSPLIRAIKEEAKRRITKFAPLWKQQNALTTLYLFDKRSNLTKNEQEMLKKSQALLTEISRLRARSNAIETSFLNGIGVDYLTDIAWKDQDA